jgi:hypothetical protein
MDGFITTRHVFTHRVRAFGIHCFARCIWRTIRAKGITTFLERL